MIVFGIFSTATTTFALCALGLPENLEHYVNIVKSFDLPRPFIFTCKALLAFPVTYHGINGIRHLVSETNRSDLLVFLVSEILFSECLLSCHACKY